MEKLKVVPFKAGEGISHTLTQRLLEKGRSYGLNAIFPFNIDVIGTLKNLGTTSTVAAKTCETHSYYGIILLE